MTKRPFKPFSPFQVLEYVSIWIYVKFVTWQPTAEQMDYLTLLVAFAFYMLLIAGVGLMAL